MPVKALKGALELGLHAVVNHPTREVLGDRLGPLQERCGLLSTEPSVQPR